MSKGILIGLALIARARVLLARVRSASFLLIGQAHSTGLIFGLLFTAAAICSAAGRKPPTTEKADDSIRFDNIGAIQRIELVRTNPRNGAAETLTLTESAALIERSTGGYMRSLTVTPDRLALFSSKLQNLGSVAVQPTSPEEALSIRLRVVGLVKKRELLIQPRGLVQPLYADFLALRNEVLTNGQ